MRKLCPLAILKKLDFSPIKSFLATYGQRVYYISQCSLFYQVRLEHVLERMTQAADTQRPSKVTENLYIGGALAAKSFHTLKHIGITHVLSLCPTELPDFRDEFNLSFDYKEIHVQSTPSISLYKQNRDLICEDCD